jgi:thiamine phosphate synthase YjbQ (UPF0047 family)
MFQEEYDCPTGLYKPSYATFLAVPIEDGELILDTWQNIVYLDFDDRPNCPSYLKGGFLN